MMGVKRVSRLPAEPPELPATAVFHFVYLILYFESVPIITRFGVTVRYGWELQKLPTGVKCATLNYE